jgi:rubrerythrin
MASKRGIRRRRCLGKHRYQDPAHAARDAADLSRKERAPVSHYRCPHCGFIHVGHTPAKTKPAPKPRMVREQCYN